MNRVIKLFFGVSKNLMNFVIERYCVPHSGDAGSSWPLSGVCHASNGNGNLRLSYQIQGVYIGWVTTFLEGAFLHGRGLYNRGRN